MAQDALYVFILGRNVDLSCTELLCVFRENNIPYKLIQNSNEVALVESRNNLDIEFLNKTLGGTVKIGKVVSDIPLDSNLNSAFSSDFLQKFFFQQNSTKVEFGISLYVCGGKNDTLSKLQSQLDNIAKSIKETLLENGIKSHYPRLDKRFLSSASVGKNKVLENGAEILLILCQDKILIAKTQAIQEFEEFSQRDYGRPVRDVSSGTMPPKLARIMINLAQIEKKDKLLDPFCGSGTILQEALILGYKNVEGSDNSQKAVTDSKLNLEWAKDKLNLDISSVKIEEADVKILSKFIKPESVDTIVTEPYLGPTLQKRAEYSEISHTLSDLKSLYLYAFSEFFKILKRSATVIIVFPAFPYYKTSHYLNIKEEIEQLGFEQMPLSQTVRKSIIVGDRNDFVLREIVKFKKI
ncbi:MAG: hypothetical protein COX79_00960 [Candidatus Levybacteria bacterium CG_4_10_14_0_2_um_filter_36_16]|nr:MAG: hypothetical protein AUK12_03750 [Candidatus Levybacteria bacterium CG2_30_37_29]PIR79181.1 MAG: hypothetical protein COU26_02505 [Candidatus Levybacteria bacterium CG10_big_fil_rev_8_21_14_0_10_36_30]PIZ97711.1 MAG: hypothetical protein COX79_00960 [Candidatus Levybacteria bacterium CG_4_10_14_0_2_um_filter_36_16]PJA90827.1 MAG: hypothetical protein CO136_00405 [Candidatus Levybacteria bacterium CG_4_9_14_3_um_filter_36_7]